MIGYHNKNARKRKIKTSLTKKAENTTVLKTHIARPQYGLLSFSRESKVIYYWL